MKKFDIKKLKYLMGAIKSDMSDDQVVGWLEKNNYTTEDFYEIIKIILQDRNNLLKDSNDN